MVTFLSMPLNLTFLPFLCSLPIFAKKQKNKKNDIPLSKEQVAKLTDLVLLPLQGFQVHLNPHCCSPYFYVWYVFPNTSTREQLHIHVTFLTIAHPCHCPSPPFIWGSPLLLEMKSRDYLIIILFMGFSRQEYWSGLTFCFPVDHVLSELSNMTCLTWVALHGMAHSFIELDKTVVHVIRLVSFLWLWFSVCLPSDGEG